MALLLLTALIGCTPELSDCVVDGENQPLRTYYVDADGDGRGGEPVEACVPGPDQVTRAGDCDDSDPSSSEPLLWFVDADGDGLVGLITISACEAPVGYGPAGGADCDDEDAAVGLERSWYPDIDGDGFGRGVAQTACAAPAGHVANDGDCDDELAAVNPSANEVCNTIDDDCDGLSDEGLVVSIWHVDADGDGAIGTGEITACAPPVGYGPVGPQDCDDADAAVGEPGLWYEDLDADQHGAGSPLVACAQPLGFVVADTDCDDTDPDVHPGALDLCNDLDDNCGGPIDEHCQDIEVTVHGDDAADAGPAASLARALERAEQRVLPLVQSRIRVGPGTFQHGPMACQDVVGAGVDGVEIRQPVILEGSGRDTTKLRFCVHRDTPAIRIISHDVEIRDLTVDVELAHPLGDGVHSGGRGEYATGLTLGRYLSSDPHEPVTNVTIERVGLDRTGYTAAGLTMVGRVSGVSVRDILLGGPGRHSTGVILHWGGHTSLAPAPYVLDDPSYEVFTTYHPHDVLVEGVVAVDVVTRMLVLSSVYDVDLSGFRGRTSEFLTMLPGDEIDLHAHISDAGRIYQDISVSDFEADVFYKANEHIVRLTSVGTSKVDGLKRTLPAANFSLDGMRVLSVDRTLGRFQYGLNASGLIGPATLSDLDFGSVGAEASAPSYGVYLRDGDSVTVDGLTTNAQTGVGVIDSTDAAVINATLSWSGGGTIASRGLYVVDTDDADDPTNSTPVTVAFDQVSITGHDISARWVGMSCDEVVVGDVTTGGAPEENLTCLP